MRTAGFSIQSKKIWGFLAILAWCGALWAEKGDFSEHFKGAVEKYQAKKFAEASKDFSEAAQLDPENVAALTNWGMAEFQGGSLFKSVGILRRALQLDPDFGPADEALKFILPKLAVKEIPHRITWEETLHTHWLKPMPLFSGLGAMAFCGAAAGWLLISYWGRRRKAIRSESLPPPVPSIGVFFGLLFVLSSVWSFAKIWDQQLERATVIEEKVAVMSGPDAQSVSLFDLYGGMEVIVEKREAKDWVFVTYPGAMSGWISKAVLLKESGPL